MSGGAIMIRTPPVLCYTMKHTLFGTAACTTRESHPRVVDGSTFWRATGGMIVSGESWPSEPAHVGPHPVEVSGRPTITDMPLDRAGVKG